jgi:muconolactone delta-isomerase
LTAGRKDGEACLRFLVLCALESPLTEGMANSVIEATEQWVEENVLSGRIEQLWGFAGQPAGGGIVRVESFDELEAMMARFPPGPFCHTKIFALHDVRQLATQARRTRNARTRFAPCASPENN